MKKLCVCGCGGEFESSINPRRKYFGKNCPFRYYKKQISSGEKPPDYYTKCKTCKKWFPCWFFKHTANPPKTCGTSTCKKRKKAPVRKQKNKEAIKERNELKRKYRYSYNKALEARTEYCSGAGNGGPQCSDYVKCLSPHESDNLIFIKYFATFGQCYKYPDEYLGTKVIYSE